MSGWLTTAVFVLGTVGAARVSWPQSLQQADQKIQQQADAAVRQIQEKKAQQQAAYLHVEMRSAARDEILKSCTNDVVGFRRVLRVSIDDEGLDNPTNRLGDAEVEFVNQLGGVQTKTIEYEIEGTTNRVTWAMPYYPLTSEGPRYWGFRTGKKFVYPAEFCSIEGTNLEVKAGGQVYSLPLDLLLPKDRASAYALDAERLDAERARRSSERSETP